MAKWYSQIPGEDLHEVLSPVSKYTTVRFMLALSVKYKWKRKLIDIKNAFFNAEISEEVYVTQPEGYVVKDGEFDVYRMKKALYRLKQASKEWIATLDKFLINFGVK